MHGSDTPQQILSKSHLSSSVCQGAIYGIEGLVQAKKIKVERLLFYENVLDNLNNVLESFKEAFNV